MESIWGNKTGNHRAKVVKRYCNTHYTMGGTRVSKPCMFSPWTMERNLGKMQVDTAIEKEGRGGTGRKEIYFCFRKTTRHARNKRGKENVPKAVAGVGWHTKKTGCPKYPLGIRGVKQEPHRGGSGSVQLEQPVKGTERTVERHEIVETGTRGLYWKN